MWATFFILSPHESWRVIVIATWAESGLKDVKEFIFLDGNVTLVSAKMSTFNDWHCEFGKIISYIA